MTDRPHKGLLPAGFRDVLPPDAAFEAEVTERLAGFFAANGYDRVRPPLVEFEETLLSGSGAATGDHVFRFMDPLSHRMMGMRADMTPQVARIATTRLINVPRPLRLGYVGPVLRVTGAGLRPERQSLQAGVELIGSARPEADAEVVFLVAEALTKLGVRDVSVDLNLPTLAPAVLAGLGVGPEKTERLRRALDHKDMSVLEAGGGASRLLGALVAACGPADRAVVALAALDLSPAAAAERDILTQVVRLIRGEAPALTLTVDPVEHRGFEYHAGVSFAVFARGAPGELGRGGRYRVGAGEAAVGATLFVDAVLEALERPVPGRRVLLPPGTPRVTARAWQAEGWVTVLALDPAESLNAAAARLGCSHILAGVRPMPA